jgi:hypothetical protein
MEVRSVGGEGVGSVGMQHQQLDRIAEIIMIELVVPDAVKLHGRLLRHHEIEP